MAEAAKYAYDKWMDSRGVPVHRGYFVEDLRTVPLGWWDQRGANSCFIQLNGLEGISEVRVTEIPPGETLPPLTLAVDETVYVVSGRGLTSVQHGDGPARSFEWQKHALFMIPGGYTATLSNMSGTEPARVMSYNYLPLAMTVIDNADYFINNPYAYLRRQPNPDTTMYAEAKIQMDEQYMYGPRQVWFGNFFPDMKAWDRLVPFKGRGAGGHVVFIRYPESNMTNHMSVFPSRTYKKAHRHGPGRAIVIPDGEGFSVMWQEGKEKVVIPWHEASLFTPPDKWFHQHFNLGRKPARYLAFHPPAQFSGYSEKVEDRKKDQIEYPFEESWIREKFEGELKARGLTTLMPDQAYKDETFEWDYNASGD